MKGSMLWRLVRKDLYFNRTITLGSMLIGAAALALANLGAAGAYAALILLVTAVMVQGVFVCMTSIVGERKEKALLFGLSLPISTGEYMAAKAISSTASYLVSSGVIAIGGLLMLSFSAIPHGLLPMAVATWLFLLDLFCVYLGISLVSESERLSGAVIVFLNISISFFFFFSMHTRSVYTTVFGPRAVWSTEVVAMIAAELGALALILAAATYGLARKQSFI